MYVHRLLSIAQDLSPRIVYTGYWLEFIVAETTENVKRQTPIVRNLMFNLVKG